MRILRMSAVLVASLSSIALAQKAVRFQAPGDYIQVPHSSSLVPSRITIEFWLRVQQLGDPNLADGEQTIIDKRSGSAGYNLRLAGKSFPLGIATLFQPSVAFFSGHIESQTWYHLAATHDGDTTRVYLNGNLIGSHAGSYSSNSTAPLRIGEHLGYPHLYLGLRGEIDEIRIWNYTRTQAQIQSAMHQKLNGTEPGLMAYWNFDDDVAPNSLDKTSNNNHGTLQGNAALVASTTPVGFIPPSAPVGLHAMGEGQGIRLSWKRSPDVSSYVLHRGTQPDLTLNSLSRLAASSASDTSYFDNTAETDVNYYYRMYVIDSQLRTSNPGKTALARRTQILDDYVTGVYYYAWYGPHGHLWPFQYLRDFLTIKQPPQLGHYSSRDLSVIPQHFNWMTSNGIDFFVSSWWGISSHENVTLRDYILPELTGRPLKFTVFYESPILGAIKDGIQEIDAAKEQRLVDDFKYLAATYFNHPNFLRISGKPVVFFYLASTLGGNFVQAFTRVRNELQALGYSLFLVGDEMTWAEPSASHMQILDAVTAYIMYGNPAHNGYPLDKDFFADVSRKVGAWESCSRANGKFFLPVVHPGFNNRGVLQGNYVAPRSITSGASHTSMYETYIKLMRPFIDSALKMLMITSWNEWHEDTQIEPTIITAPTYQDISGTNYYTQNYAYSGYGTGFLRATRELLASGLPTNAETPARIVTPVLTQLHQNFPNPFNSTSTIKFSIAEKTSVKLTIHNILGQKIETLVQEEKEAGIHQITWDATHTPSGMYFYRMQAGHYAETKKLLLLK